MLALVGLVASISAIKKKNKLFLITFRQKRSCFLISRYLISVQLVFHIYIFYPVVQLPRSLSSYLSNKDITNVPLSISCSLEAVYQQVKYSLIWNFLTAQTNTLFPWSLVAGKKLSESRTLNKISKKFQKIGKIITK